MHLVALFHDAAPFSLLLALLLVPTVLACLVVGGSWIAGLRTSPALPIGVLVLPIATGMVGHAVGIRQALEAAATATPEVKPTLMAAGVVMASTSDLLAAASLVVPLLLLALLAAVAGLRSTPRRTGLPGLALCGAIAAAALLVVGATRAEGTVAWVPGALTCLVGGGGAAVALYAADRSRPGPTAGAAAAAGLPLLVAAVADVGIRVGLFRAFHTFSALLTAQRAPILADALAMAGTERRWAALAVLVASVVAVAGCLGGLTHDDGSEDRLRSQRNATILAALVTIPLAFLLLASADPLALLGFA